MNDGAMTPLSYGAGTVVSDELVFILSQGDDLNNQGVDHTKALRWKNGQWGRFMIDWATTRIAHERRDGAVCTENSILAMKSLFSDDASPISPSN